MHGQVAQVAGHIVPNRAAVDGAQNVDRGRGRCRAQNGDGNTRIGRIRPEALDGATFRNGGFCGVAAPAVGRNLDLCVGGAEVDHLARYLKGGNS